MNPEIAAKFTANQEPSTGVNNDKLGMWIFLSSEIIFFAVLISAAVALSLRPENNTWDLVRTPYAEAAIVLATINTFILIMSSVFVVSAIDAIQKGKTAWMKFWLWATLVGGGAFLFNQSREWAELSHELEVELGVGGFAGAAENVFGAAFYTLTGFHGAHVLIGVFLLLYVMIRAYRGDFRPDNYNALEMFGLYWHFVDLVWIILFTVLYLI